MKNTSKLKAVFLSSIFWWIPTTFRLEPPGNHQKKMKYCRSQYCLHAPATARVFLQDTMLFLAFPRGSRSIRSPDSLTWLCVELYWNSFSGESRVQLHESIANFTCVLGGVFNCQDERVFILSAEWRYTTINKYPKRILVWSSTYKMGSRLSSFIKLGETFSLDNYIHVIRPHAQSEEERCLSDVIVHQLDHTTPHKHRKLLEWCEVNLMLFIDNHRWTPDSSDLSVLNYYAWNGITSSLH